MNIQHNVIPLNQHQKKTPSTDAADSLLSTFVSKFTTPQFIENTLNVLLYPSSPNIAIQSSVDITTFLKKFIILVRKDLATVKINSEIPVNVIRKYFDTLKYVLDIKSDMSTIQITYHNVLQYFQKRDINIDKLLRQVVNTQLTSLVSYRQLFDDILLNIQAYNELHSVRSTFIEFDIFMNDAKNNETPILNTLKNYKELISNSYSSLSKLEVVSKTDNLSDYFVLGGDKDELSKVSQSLTTFLQSGYNFYKTGYSLIDLNLGGLESGSVTIISGPSNHAKSIFMINLVSKIVQNNEFEPNDCLLFITLEDSIYKLIRRVISIFGNYCSVTVRDIFIRLSKILKEQKDIKSEKIATSNSAIIKDVVILIEKLLEDSLRELSGKNVKVILKHSDENTFSPQDTVKFMNDRTLVGYKIKALAIDYIDVMQPTGAEVGKFDDYNGHGAIVQELRFISRTYQIPIITITQNAKTSENPQMALSNTVIGNSYKKIQYGDYVYMIRMRPDLDINGDAVKADIDDLHESSSSNSLETMLLNEFSDSYIKNLIAFEVKITKAKEGIKDKVKFHIFNGNNLQIHDYLSEYYTSIKRLKKTKTYLLNQLELLDNSLTVQFSNKTNLLIDQTQNLI
jgi:replicative DNA helicase